MINKYSFYPVTDSALNWRDLDVKEQRLELALRVGLVAGIIILIAGECLAIYYSVKIHFIIVLPSVIFGIPGIIGLILGLYYCKFDRDHGESGDLTNNDIRNGLISDLTKRGLEVLYKRFYKRNGGLKALVNNGYITEEQGNALRVLFKEYHAQKTIIDEYRDLPNARKAIDNNRYPQKYYEAYQEIKKLEQSWSRMQYAIRQQYFGKAAPVVEPKTDPPQVIPVPVVPQPTSEQKWWSSLSLEEQRCNLILRIVCVASAIIIIVGMAVAIYYCSTTTHTAAITVKKLVKVGFDWMVQISRETIQISNASFALLPAAGALAAIAGSVFGFCFHANSVCERQKFGQEEDLDKPHLFDDRMLLLTEGSLNDVCGHYCTLNGGLGPLVRKSLLTPSQGEELKKLFAEHKVNESHLDPYINRPTPFTAFIIANPQQSKAFNTLVQKKKRLEDQWKVLQTEIAKNFKPAQAASIAQAAAIPEQKNEVQAYILQGNLNTHNSSLNILPEDVFNHLATFMPVSDLGHMAQVKQLNASATRALNERLVEYQTRDIPQLFACIETLVEEGYILQEWVVYKTSRLFSRLDREATLRKLLHMQGEERANMQDKLGEALLFYCKEGDLPMVKTLLSLNASLEVRDAYGNTPIGLAATKVSLEIVKALIAKGADPNALNHGGQTSLVRAHQITRYLLENGAALSINQIAHNGQAAIHDAATRNDVEMLLLLLHFGADKNLPDSQGRLAAQ